MNQPPISQETTSPANMLAHYHKSANEFYMAGNYRQALKELKQALSYASTEQDIEVIESNMRTISQLVQEEEVNTMESPESTVEEQGNEMPLYQNKMLLLTILVGLICLTPIVMKCIEIFTPKPVAQVQQETPASTTPQKTEATETVSTANQAVAPVVPEGMITGNGVALRSEASTQSAALTRLSQNEKVEILEDKSQNAGGYVWSKIKTTSGLTGWVSASFITQQTTEPAVQPIAENTQATPTETTTLDQTPASSLPASSAATKKINAAGVSFRSGPSVSQALITTLPAQTEIEVLQSATVTADGLTWSQIKTSQGTVGWVASKYITE
ncbi:hypothetical protein COW36_11125 [bacterium (Candidatus Blackallbacteria) CG17_big_fil_post_rev_8_21_14_2_50_48_46]|uniref:SH3b domain-containing protein n=1 Tax=bacterium (Candidatus Blackallbacteria) CG17_big_fil_post_rev_8_21_14_2_50_48_46 TaxID=2014261 RepID=A0A2M7G4I5_9BACT|nr:MAG: hypothetical protein COW64_18220 [bacterium (Candidatus Blackallbacteria) CG18_big_fil_WC_8_21_14_2_50_49_26]PIW16826.1 MAG: hypothetical protein COW36_11125 [bacterium (Candidatus Blackallbacteria) CG17_big_fil_post_rev_8_21_14_2_50_48_46]PIW48023.1 MAG: hypothetical protein COW20_10840 [bacterium (Candidatus Blackallbacteria) CG13_big_fil_rev_8_21_14_2_50_49_14]